MQVCDVKMCKAYLGLSIRGTRPAADPDSIQLGGGTKVNRASLVVVVVLIKALSVLAPPRLPKHRIMG